MIVAKNILPQPSFCIDDVSVVEGDSGTTIATFTVSFAGQTFSGTTDSNGVFRTGWINDLASGNHDANAVDLALTGYVWNPLDLDLEDDSDGDGLPDDLQVL